METRAFAPCYGPSNAANTTGTKGGFLTSTTVSASGSAATSGQFAGCPNGGRYQIQIANTTSAWAYVNMGNLAIGLNAATVAASYPVAPGGVVVVSVDPEVDAASVILASSSGNVVFTTGEGL